MPPPRRELIVGGRVATPYDLPFAVSIGHVNSTTNGSSYWQHQCGGTLVADRWVLTARHCVPGCVDMPVPGEPDCVPNIDELRVVLHTHNITSAHEKDEHPCSETLELTRVELHPVYFVDLALLELEQGAADGGGGDELARPVLQDENGDGIAGIAGDELARRIVPFYAIAHVASGHTRTRARVGARDPRAAGAAVDANLLSSFMRPYNISTGHGATLTPRHDHRAVGRHVRQLVLRCFLQGDRLETEPALPLVAVTLHFVRLQEAVGHAAAALCARLLLDLDLVPAVHRRHSPHRLVAARAMLLPRVPVAADAGVIAHVAEALRGAVRGAVRPTRCGGAGPWARLRCGCAGDAWVLPTHAPR